MKKLFIMGNCYSDDDENAKELFNVLEDAGYTLAYNSKNIRSATIMKEVEVPDEQDEPEETDEE